MAMHDTRYRHYRSRTERSARAPLAFAVPEGDTLTFDNELDRNGAPYYVDLGGDFSIGEVDAVWKGDDVEQCSMVRLAAARARRRRDGWRRCRTTLRRGAAAKR